MDVTETTTKLAETTFSASLYASLFAKLITVLELSQSEGTSGQTLYEATIDFKKSLELAKELAESLPGGEMLIQDQDEVIDMLVGLRDRKREQLNQFASKPIRRPIQVDMEIDSVASTPCDE